MFTFSCNILTEESRDVAEAAYSSSWMSMPLNKIGKVLRKDILLIIMRARKPCSLSAGGFFNVSLETYTAVKFILIMFPNELNNFSIEYISFLGNEYRNVVLYFTQTTQLGSSWCLIDLYYTKLALNK